MEENKKVSVIKIEPTSPMASTYAKTVRNWDQEGVLNIKKNNKLVPIYAVFLGDFFAAASVAEFDKENSKLIINILNGSSIKATTLAIDATEKVTEKVIESYNNAEEIEVNYVKKLVK